VAEPFSILWQRECLVAVINGDLSDPEVLQLRDEIAERVGRKRARSVIVDVTALDVIDSFIARALRSLALAMKLRGAQTIVVGIQPDVAIAMVQFGLNLQSLRTALDLDEALAAVGQRPA
jgi:rsbT antagonist protein RsbS